MRELLVNRARSFIYTTGLPPSVVGSALGALAVVEKAGNPGAELLARAAVFRKSLQQAGLETLNSESQIIPVLIGENARTLAVAHRLRAKGILTVAIRPPTVPEGTARLRLSVTLDHTAQDLEWAARRNYRRDNRGVWCTRRRENAKKEFLLTSNTLYPKSMCPVSPPLDQGRGGLEDTFGRFSLVCFVFFRVFASSRENIQRPTVVENYGAAQTVNAYTRDGK